MSAICEKLPFELANIVYSYLGEHPVAKLIREEDEKPKNEFCDKCSLYVADKDKNGKCVYIVVDEGYCEYCYSEELGIDVYTCNECCCKTFDWTDFNNTEEGLFCNNCYDDYLERTEELEEVD
jgi:hypothetical protein